MAVVGVTVSIAVFLCLLPLWAVRWGGRGGGAASPCDSSHKGFFYMRSLWMRMNLKFNEKFLGEKEKETKREKDPVKMKAEMGVMKL